MCNNPTPEHDGSACKGEDDETKSCVLQKYCPSKEINSGSYNILYCISYWCIVDGGWSEWTEWSSCSTTCEEGIQRRKRVCNNPVPEHGGSTCKGEDNITKICVRKECPSKELNCIIKIENSRACSICLITGLCNPNPCFSGTVQCTNVNRTHFTCGSCPAGYEGNGILCHDINEVYKENSKTKEQNEIFV